MRSINPYTEELNSEFAEITEEDMFSYLEKARSSQKKWQEVLPSERARLAADLAVHLRSQKQEYAETITREMGKPIKESISEIEKCAWLCEYFAENTPQFLEPEKIEAGHMKSYVSFEPLGVVLGIMPWNFPFWQVFRFAVPALMAGNTVLLKHASNVPMSSLSIERAFLSVFPEDSFRSLLASSHTVGKLLPHVDAISLTGSNKAGEHVAAIAGREIKPIVLELGGSDPYIVLADADIEKAAKTAALARNINAGQSCIAAKRFIIVKEVYDDFLARFSRHFRTLKVGDPLDNSTDIGPVAREQFMTDLRKQVEDSIAMGATIHTEVQAPVGKGHFFNPVILTNVTPEMRVMTEEVFGPVAPVIRAEDEEDAIRLANETIYGLGSSLWTEDREKAQKLARRIQAGFVAVNDMVKSDPRMPFGGIKKSGVGRELSRYGMMEFVNKKSVVID